MTVETPTRARELIADHLGVPVDRVTDAAKFRADLGADSLDVISLTIELEEAFDVEIGDDEADGCATVGEALALLSAKVGERA